MILVTGATGLVGAHLLLALARQNDTFFAICQENESTESVQALFEKHNNHDLFQKIEWRSADINDLPSLELAFESCTHVYHCAEKFSLDYTEEKQLRKVNIEGTANVVNICLAKKVQKICFLSAVEALGALPEVANNNNSGQLIDEENEWNGALFHSDYAISKYGAEMEIWRAQQEGLQTVIVNPGVILGPLDQKWKTTEKSGFLISKVGNNKKKFGPGSTGFVSVDDVVKCMITLMKSPLESTRYILVSENCSFHHFFTLVAKKLNVTPPNSVIKNWVSELHYRWNWLLSVVFLQKNLFSKSEKQWLFEDKKYSNKRVCQDFDFEFEPIAATIENYL